MRALLAAAIFLLVLAVAVVARLLRRGRERTIAFDWPRPSDRDEWPWK
jgi:hypothetical protein